MTEPTYTDDELAAAEAEVPDVDPADEVRVPLSEDTEAAEPETEPDELTDD